MNEVAIELNDPDRRFREDCIVGCAISVFFVVGKKFEFIDELQLPVKFGSEVGTDQRARQGAKAELEAELWFGDLVAIIAGAGGKIL